MNKYAVTFAFSYNEKFYTKGNEHEVEELPQEVIDEFVEAGSLKLVVPQSPHLPDTTEQEEEDSNKGMTDGD